MKKLVFIIYFAVIAATVLCAIPFKQYLNVHVESLIPLLNLCYMLYSGHMSYKQRSYFYKGRWHHYSDSFNFKYTKNSNGDGEFKVMKSGEGPEITSLIMAYSMFIGAAFNIPLIAFFSLKIKVFSVAIMLISLAVGFFVSLPFDIKQSKKQIEDDEARREQWEKELEEQKKREELGKWK